MITDVEDLTPKHIMRNDRDAHEDALRE